MVESELASGTVEIFDVSMGHAIKHKVYNSFGNALYRKTVMKILSGAIVLSLRSPSGNSSTWEIL